MEVNPPLFVLSQEFYGPDELALPFRDILAEGVTGIGTEQQVTQRAAGANKQVDIADGACWIHGDENVAAQGAYRCRNNGITTLTITDNTSGNPRVDRVIAEVLDSQFAGASNLWRLRVVPGTPGASPVAPALPNNAISLATVAVANAFTSIVNANITDTRLRAVPFRGGEINYTEITASVTVNATTEAGANTIITTPTIAFDGSPVYVEFWSPYVQTAGATGAAVDVFLVLDSIVQGRLFYLVNPGGPTQQLYATAHGRRRLAVAAGNHTLTVKALRTFGDGLVVAGGSGPGPANTPAFLRITRA